MGGQRAASAAPPALRLELMGGFALLVGDERLVVPPTVQRLLSFVAVHRRPVSRSQVCAVLWPDSCDEKAAASLRTALWRVPVTEGEHVVCSSSEQLWLAPWVQVDVHRAQREALALVDASRSPQELTAHARALCSHDDLLPGWYEDWVLNERERLRQLRLHALDRVGDLLLSEGRYGDALQVALSSIADEPLRESGHRLAVRAHLAEGNIAEALRYFRSYAALLTREIGLGPSPEMLSLCKEYLPAPVGAGTVGPLRRVPVPVSSAMASAHYPEPTDWQGTQTVHGKVTRLEIARSDAGD